MMLSNIVSGYSRGAIMNIPVPHPLLDQAWYYSIELSAGIVTPGMYGHATRLTRDMLRGCEIENQRCLDIGPMEGMIPAVLARKKAASITGIDVTVAHVPKIELVKASLGFDIDFVGPTSLRRAPELFRTQDIPAFDVVVFSGVLYHVVDIASSLMAVRSLVRSGGLVIVESWIKAGEEGVAYFNLGGRFTEESNTYWFVDVAALDYLLRMFWLEPLDCAYFPAPDGTLRLATVCRAMNGPAHAGDRWLRSTEHGSADISFMRQELLRSDSDHVLNYGDMSLAGRTLQEMMRTRKPTVVSNEGAALYLRDPD